MCVYTLDLMTVTTQSGDSIWSCQHHTSSITHWLLCRNFPTQYTEYQNSAHDHEPTGMWQFWDTQVCLQIWLRKRHTRTGTILRFLPSDLWVPPLVGLGARQHHHLRKAAFLHPLQQAGAELLLETLGEEDWHHLQLHCNVLYITWSDTSLHVVLCQQGGYHPYCSSKLPLTSKFMVWLFIG